MKKTVRIALSGKERDYLLQIEQCTGIEQGDLMRLALDSLLRQKGATSQFFPRLPVNIIDASRQFVQLELKIK